MNKKELAVLENVFLAEIQNRLPFQTKSKLAQDLAERGFLEYVEAERRGTLGVLTIAGYCLTHLGRLTCCESCTGPEVM